MIRGTTLILLIILGSVSSNSLAQKPKNPQVNIKKSANQKVVANDQKRKLNILRVKAFAERASGFSDLKLRSITLSRIADLLWVDDQAYSRQLFLKAIDFASRKDEITLKETKLTARGLAKIRRQVIGYISRRDSDWAKRLIDSEVVANERESFSISQVNIETAYDLALNDQAKSAVEFAERSLKSGVSPWMTGVLMELRRKNEAAANQLFLKVVEQLANQPNIDPNTLLYIGTYIFTSPKVDPADPTGVAQVGVGRLIVYDITADRPNIPPFLVRAYLEAATRVLTQSKPTAEQLALYYVADYLVLAKAQRLAPDLAPLISAAMQALATDVPRELLDSTTYKNLAESVLPGIDESLAEIEKMTGQDRRDERYLALIALLWRKKECEQARLVANKISDLDLRSRLNSLIDFREAALILEGSEIPRAEKIAEKLSPTIERAVLLLAIARAHVQANQLQAATDSLTNAAQTVRRVEDPRRSFVLFITAGEMLKVSPALGITLFEEAIKHLNDQKAEHLRTIVWAEKVGQGRALRVFPLAITGLTYEYESAFRDLTKVDAEAAIQAVNAITDETSCANAMLAVVSALL